MKPGEVRRSSAGDVVGGHDVACSVFLARHSAYIDDELMPRERSAHERHEAACASCARYARVLASGVDALRSLPALEPSPDFEARLQHRLFHVQDEAALGPRGRNSRVWLAAAASLALLVAGDRVLDGRTADNAGAGQANSQAASYDAAGWAPGWDAPADRAAVWDAPAWDAQSPEAPAWEARVWDAASQEVSGWEVRAWVSPASAPVPASTTVLLHSQAYSPVVVQPPLFRRISAVATD